MTITKAISLDESLAIGVNSAHDDAPGSGGKVFVHTFDIARAVPLRKTTSFKSYIEKSEAIPERAALLAEARKRVANELYGDEPPVLSSLRMNAGLSQGELAQKSGLLQSQISRIERGTTDPGTQTIRKIATALKMEFGAVCEAIDRQISTRSL